MGLSGMEVIPNLPWEICSSLGFALVEDRCAH